MPDDTLDMPLTGEGDDEMSAEFTALHEQNMASLGAISTMYMGDLKTVSKAADYSYLQDKDLVSLAEAVGVREVGSRVNPAGPSPSTPVA